MASGKASSLRTLARLFLRLGASAFGGPAAHIALLHDEVVLRRRWLTEQHFLDLMGATNLIPGPNSTEMVMHVGFERRRVKGLILSGACFILPAALIVGALAWAYVRYGTTPAARSLLYGVEPVVIAVVAQALFGLGRTAVKNVLLAALGAAVFALYFLGVNEIALLIGGGVLLMVLHAVRSRRARGAAAVLPLGVLPFGVLPGMKFAAAAVAVQADLVRLFLVFLKTGALLFGSGYVLLAFLRNDLVVQHGWLTGSQLVDAVAIGQLTPGPVFTTATFVGYLIAGMPGAVLATVAIFLPSFFFVGLLNPLIPKLRGSPLAAAFLDGINVCALALMAGVTYQLGRTALIDPLTVAIAGASLALLLRLRVNSTWLILGGAALGLAFR